MNDELKDLKAQVQTHDKALFGDRENPEERPGIISELRAMNVTLVELRDAMRLILGTVVVGVISAVLVWIFRTPPGA